MASSALEEVEKGSRVFVDATIFIYHFTGASLDCRRFMESCERGSLTGFTSVIALAEVAHRLMMIEAVTKGLISPGNPARKLREKPAIVKELFVYQEQIELIPLMGITVLPLDLEIPRLATDLRHQYGLLVNDSLLAASAAREGIQDIASADPDFERVEELRLFRPADL